MKPERTNEDFCPVCNREWDLCECESDYKEQDLIDQDDDNIESGFNIY